MKLTHIAATLYGMGLGKSVDTRPAIASMQRDAVQEHLQLRKQARAMKNRKGKSQSQEL